MKGNVLVDSGPIVASLVRGDEFREWACEQLDRLPPPLLTCEPVLTEACHLVWKHGGDPAFVLDMVERGLWEIAFTVEDHISELSRLMRRYRNVPMSLADACLVRMAELRPKAIVLTVDSDFRIYRKHGRHVVPTLMPPNR